jgi:hypothetical protein
MRIGSDTPGRRDGRAAQDCVSAVEDRGLAGGYAASRGAQVNAQLVSGKHRDALVDLAVGAELDRALDRRDGRLAARPYRADRGDLADAEGVGGADGHGVGHWLDGQHVARAPVGGRAVDAQALALADREAVSAVVGAEHGPVRVDDRTGRRPEAPLKEAAGVAVGDEADVVAVGLVGD